MLTLSTHTHTETDTRAHTYASKEGRKVCTQSSVSATHTFDLRQTAGAKGGGQLADLPSGTGYSLSTLVWSRRERRTREIRKEGSGETGEVLGGDRQDRARAQSDE